MPFAPRHAPAYPPSHVRPRATRAGLTLVEVVAALFVMGLTAALVVPSLGLPRPEAASLERVVEAARSTAITRSQVLTLAIDRDGAWSLASAVAGPVIRQGRLPRAPASALSLQLSPLGSCTPAGPPLVAWDAIRCTAASATSASRSR